MNSSSAKRVAVIDVGSNTIKLIIASRGKRKPIRIEDFIVEDTRIGEGMTGNPPTIDNNAIERGTDAIARLAKIAHEKTNTLSIVATSAVRDATNKQAFVAKAESKSGHKLTVLTGEEEADLIGRGLQCDPKLKNLTDFFILDLGGGSLECIQFSNRKSIQSQSFQLGAVRLASLLLENRKCPLSSKDEESITKHVANTWITSNFANASSPSSIVVITGGTSSILADIMDKRQITLSEFSEIKTQICNANLASRIANFDIPKSRADIFPTALVTIEQSLKHLDCQTIRFSKYNLRYGVADMSLGE